MRHIESDLQQSCINYFRLLYPDLADLCFAVPNGGARNRREGATLKREGVRAGVADVIILHPSADRRFHSLCVEFKTDTGRQSPAQRKWMMSCRRAMNRYEIVRSFEEFAHIVREHFSGSVDKN